jgi:hypothetical protein
VFWFLLITHYTIWRYFCKELRIDQVRVYYDPHPPVLKVFISHGGKDYGDARIVNTYANSQVKRGSHSKKNVNEDKVSGLPATLLATNMGES